MRRLASSLAANMAAVKNNSFHAIRRHSEYDPAVAVCEQLSLVNTGSLTLPPHRPCTARRRSVSLRPISHHESASSVFVDNGVCSTARRACQSRACIPLFLCVNTD